LAGEPERAPFRAQPQALTTLKPLSTLRVCLKTPSVAAETRVA
jgi:hypothetical protein